MLSTVTCSFTCRQSTARVFLGQVKDAVIRLVKLHGRGLPHDRVIALTVWPSPDGKYFIKGGPKGLEKVSRSQRALPPAGYYPRQALRRDRKRWGGCAKGGKRKKGHNQPMKVIHSWPFPQMAAFACKIFTRFWSSSAVANRDEISSAAGKIEIR